MKQLFFIITCSLFIVTSTALAQNTSKYRGFVDLGYTVGLGDYGLDRMELVTSHGRQFNPHLYLGLGTGIHYYADFKTTFLPLFIDFRSTLAKSTSSPFLGLKLGYSLNTKDDFNANFYVAPSFGVRFMITEKAAMNLSIGYSAQRIDFITYYPTDPRDYYGEYSYEESSEMTSGFSFKIGVEF